MKAIDAGPRRPARRRVSSRSGDAGLEADLGGASVLLARTKRPRLVDGAVRQHVQQLPLPRLGTSAAEPTRLVGRRFGGRQNVGQIPATRPREADGDPLVFLPRSPLLLLRHLVPVQLDRPRGTLEGRRVPGIVWGERLHKPSVT